MQNITIKRDEYFKLKTENIILKDIYVKNNLKNYILLNSLLKLLAMTNNLLSAKEIKEILEHNGIKFSHITIIEYLDYILESGLVKKVFRYDLKTENKSTGKAKYLFSSYNVRKAILNNNIEKSIINENIVYNVLIKLGEKDIYTGKNGTYNFAFYTNNIIVDISKNTKKQELKKEINKLLKIEWKSRKVFNS
ncbi:MAG: hypothetical protein Q9M97_09845 [Candidatus Gracilibacteria bacterium]|nr:hypothetical protein [Candidatus Gracilibacteria bacterium]